MDTEVRSWFDRATTTGQHWHARDLIHHKGQQRVSVVLPALNEAATIGSIVATIHDELVVGPAQHRLVDELVVIDSGSTDGTAAIASSAGARVVHRDDIFTRLPSVPGKGEAMWRSLAATDGDILVFIDADLRSFTSTYVVGLLGPLLTDPEVALVKAMYERPLVDGDVVIHAGGGRVTELVARPLLALHWPSLAGVVQPLAGEYAARRNLLQDLPFPCGYGVEFALLVDTYERLGLDAIAQVDLGVRLHRHHDERVLGRMSAEIWQTALDRLDPGGRLRTSHSAQFGVGTTMTQFDRGLEGFETITHDIAALVRPPIAEMPEYRTRQDTRG